MTEGNYSSQIQQQEQRVMKKKGHETLLVVDDDPAVLDILDKILSPLGYNLLLAENGEKALEYAEKHASHIDLLLTDMILTGMNGRELAEYFMDVYPEIKVMFMSGYICPSIAHQDVPFSEKAFLKKPFTPGELVKKMRKVLLSEQIYN